MLKFIVFFIIAVGAAFGIPAIRAKIMPPLIPVFDKLGPLGDMVVNPAKRWSARNEENALLRKLAEDHADKKPMPKPINFQMWMKTNTHLVKKGLDPWGRYYYFVPTRNSLTVGSNGPDMERDTPDDVRVTAPLN